ncbi:unnamed protein product [Kuraishia capsulata CBS 1993]|uniref:D-isomer specific 2-hydroxyacid dehydrogenase NAD-binding domain-containing protein n=1 Tax=Kuraishia capsulata CBS 1993 TaxID=1382522 RepID=W6MRQ6_9ASCO|nr:uncharacterized protein KUCA_T00003912001 [Kuraishia capsulata CBS 1993]CDK27932.1 unnamed protein product [Kuraishia capsulata CBS 1993]
MLFRRFYSAMSKPQVLRLGPVRYAHRKWDELAKLAEVVQTTAENRSEFIKELDAGKWDKVVAITRTFDSVEVTGRFDEELASHFPPSVKAVCHNGAGYDQVDIPPFLKRKIQVSNVPSIVDDATADTHIYLLLSALRNFQHSHHLLLQGKWETETAKCGGAPIGNDPKGKTLGIFGMGGIGRAVRDRAAPFGFGKVIYHNRNRLSPDLEKDAEYVSFDELLAQSDIVSINIPLNPATRHSINKESISKMKDGVVIINTARGAVIDESALIEALKSGKVKSCGLDVFEHEPHVPKELLELPNVVSLPHMGTHTHETMQSMEEWVVTNVEDLLSKGKVTSIVPELKNESY